MMNFTNRPHGKKILIKKLAALSMAMCIITSLAACTSDRSRSTEAIKEQITQADMEIFDYEALKERAKVIVKVSVMDALTEQNSRFLYDEYDDAHPVIDYYALRSVRIIETYKDELNLTKDEIHVAEAAAMEDSTLYHYEGYEPLKKGNAYILFLGNDTEPKHLSIISCENGKVNLDHIEKSNDMFYEIAAKAVIDFETELPEKKKQEFRKAEILKAEASGPMHESIAAGDNILVRYQKQEDGSYETELKERTIS